MNTIRYCLQSLYGYGTENKTYELILTVLFVDIASNFSATIAVHGLPFCVSFACLMGREGSLQLCPATVAQVA